MWWHEPASRTQQPTTLTRGGVLVPVTSRQAAWRATKLVLFFNALMVMVGPTSRERGGDRGTFFSMGGLGLIAMGSLLNLPSLVEL